MARVPHPTKHAALTYKEPFSVKMGRYAVRFGIVFGVLFVVYCVIWFATAMMLRSGIQDWFIAQKQAGYIASYNENKARIGGFPFSVRASISNVALSPPADETQKRSWFWSAKKVDLQIIPLPGLMNMVHVDVPSDQVLRLGALNYSGKAKEFRLSVNWLSEGLPDDLGLKIRDLEMTSSKAPLKIQTLDFKGMRKGGGTYGIDTKAEGLIVPGPLDGLGRTTQEFIVRGFFTENFLSAGTSPQDLESWRDAGGVFELKRFHLAHAPVLIQSSATLALDGDLQPVGAFSTRFQGFFEVVEQMRRNGLIRRQDATMAKVVLGMLAKQPDHGGPATISLPLSIQNQGLYAGPVRLVELPKIKW